MTTKNSSDHPPIEVDPSHAQEWLRYSQTFARFGIWEWNTESDIVKLSEQAQILFGYENKPLEIMRADFLKTVHAADRQRVLDAVYSCTNGNKDISCPDAYDIQYRIVKADGAVRWLRDRGGMVQCDNRGAERVLGVVQDVTEQKNLDLALTQIEEHFRLISENTREVIWIASTNLDRLLYVNSACLGIFGVDRNDLYVNFFRWREVLYPADVSIVDAALLKQKQGLVSEVEARIILTDGKIRWIRVRSFPVKNDQGEMLASGIVEDISDRRKCEEERLAHMLHQRTSLVREVHHRIKNNLQGVAGLLRQKAIECPEVSAIIDQAIAQVRSVAVVHGLQGQALDNEIVLCEVVPSIANMVEAFFSGWVKLEVSVDVPQRIRVIEQEAVPIALILNELIMNSAKHVSIKPESQSIVSIKVGWDPLLAQVVICIVNPGILPEAFDFTSAKGIGTGLDLVRSLLPSDGCKVTFGSNNGQVKTILQLSSPSIYNLQGDA